MKKFIWVIAAISLFICACNEKEQKTATKQVSAEEVQQVRPQEVTEMTTTKSGIISKVVFEPIYRHASECGDCGCDGYGGGTLQIHMDTPKGSVIDTIQEKGHLNFCVSPDMQSEYNSYDTTLLDPATCVKPEINNTIFLPLFQEGVKLKAEHCVHKQLQTREYDGSPYFETYSCGDTLTISFTGEIKDISPEPRYSETFEGIIPYNPEEKVLCSYKITVAENGNTITTRHFCKDVIIASTYKINAKVVRSDYHDSEMDLFCSGDYLFASLDFELMDASNKNIPATTH